MREAAVLGVAARVGALCVGRCVFLGGLRRECAGSPGRDEAGRVFPRLARCARRISKAAAALLWSHAGACAHEKSMASGRLCSRFGLSGPHPPAPSPGGEGETATGGGVAESQPHDSVAGYACSPSPLRGAELLPHATRAASPLPGTDAPKVGWVWRRWWAPATLSQRVDTLMGRPRPPVGEAAVLGVAKLCPASSSCERSEPNFPTSCVAALT